MILLSLYLILIITPNAEQSITEYFFKKCKQIYHFSTFFIFSYSFHLYLHYIQYFLFFCCCFFCLRNRVNDSESQYEVKTIWIYRKRSTRHVVHTASYYSNVLWLLSAYSSIFRFIVVILKSISTHTIVNCYKMYITCIVIYS